MELGNNYNLQKIMNQGNILFSFNGVITLDIISSVLQIMESQLGFMGETLKTRKKVLHVLTECLQNLYHYKFINEEYVKLIAKKPVLLCIAKESKYFQIETGNYIKKSDSNNLSWNLDKINKLNQNQLKQYYYDVFSNRSIPQKGNAGLGMIYLARKSGNKLEYQFLDVNDKTSFFCLKIRIEKL
jgi:hypothetical protein